MQRQQGGKKNRKLGRWEKKPCNKAYKANGRRVKNKLKRVRQSNGLEAAQKYAIKNGVIFKEK